MIFSRGARHRGRHARGGRAYGAHGVAGQVAPAPRSADPEPPVPRTGPYDIGEAPPGVRRWDLGSLKIPSLPGVQLRVQAGPDGSVRRAILLAGRSALHLVAFAAPRTAPIWAGVREELRAVLLEQQGEVTDAVGQFGPELLAKVPVPGGFKLLRLAGVDGPRWLVRADFHGPAALEPSAAEPLVACLCGVVVDRGPQARPVREPLPMRLTEGLTAELRQQAGAAPGAGPDPEGS